MGENISTTYQNTNFQYLEKRDTKWRSFCLSKMNRDNSFFPWKSD